MPIRTVFAFWETIGCTSKNAGCPKQFPNSHEAYELINSYWTYRLLYQN